MLTSVRVAFHGGPDSFDAIDVMPAFNGDGTKEPAKSDGRSLQWPCSSTGFVIV